MMGGQMNLRWAFLLALLLAPGAAYNLTVFGGVYSGSCPAGWTRVASLSHRSNAHVAGPDYADYGLKLCVYGDSVDHAGYKARGSLASDESAILGIYQSGNSHAQGPSQGTYSNVVYLSCPVNSTLRSGDCQGEEECILELYKTDDSHVAECGESAGYRLCVQTTEPDDSSDACTCVSQTSSWLTDAGLFGGGTTGNCCGDDEGEGLSNPLDGTTGGCSVLTSEDVCCPNNYCGNKTGASSYECLAPGSACGGKLCSESDWLECTASLEDSCINADLNNDGYYDKFCDNSTGTWKGASNSTDMCQVSCQQADGIWTGQNTYPEDTKNCCSSADAGSWCLASTQRVTKCEAGVPTDCGAYCDSQGTVPDGVVSDYVCSSETDIDCTSIACSGSDCECTKGEGTGCYDDSACASASCTPFNYTADDSSYFSPPSHPLDTQNGGSFDGICCPDNACPLDLDGNGTVESCVANGTKTGDSDVDGDMDYCYEGLWKECQSYVCTSASACSCMGNSTHSGACHFYTETAGTYSTGTGDCYIQNTTLECATPCDLDGNTTTREYIGQTGICKRGGGSCLDIYKDLEWGGNSSLSFVNASVDCLCASQANCTVEVYNQTGGLSSTQNQLVAANGGYSPFWLHDAFEKGTNTINITCSCGPLGGVPPASCTRSVAELDYDASSSLTAERFKVGTTEQVDVTVNNLGDVPLASFQLGAMLQSGGASVVNVTDQGYLAAGASRTIPLLLDVSIDMFNATNQTVSNETTIVVFTNVTDLQLLYDLQQEGYTYQCDAVGDCPTACPSAAPNCWAFGSGTGNFSCSYGVCCPDSQHFQDGACCPLGYSCCVSDASCSDAEWCANASAYSDFGITWSCNDLLLNGQGCNEDRMCSSANCESTPQGSDTYCCQAILTTTEVGGECTTLQGGEVCSSSGCCTSDAQCLSGKWCALYGNRCVDCPDATSEGYFNGYCASTTCVGTDIDCCTVNSDCDPASNQSSYVHYCNNDTSTCEACTTSLDYYCPDMRCHEEGTSSGDPDCCNDNGDCVEGTKCQDNTCVPENIGKYCTSDSDCGAGDDYSCVDSRCILNDFVTLNPSSITEMQVGQVRYASVIVRDPQLRSDTYTLSLARDYQQFASLESGNSMSITLGPNQVKKFTMVVYGGKSTDALQDGVAKIKVYVSSQTTAGISHERTLTVDINSVGGSGVVAAAPGLTLRDSVAVLVIGGVLAWSLKKL